MSLTNEQFNQQRPALLNEKHQNVLENIRKLQEIEKYMFQNLEKLIIKVVILLLKHRLLVK